MCFWHRRYVRRCLFALALSGLLACQSPGPTAPGKIEIPDPVPVDGTKWHEISVPGESVPVRVWITAMTPKQNAQLVPWSVASISFTCDGPAGSTMWLDAQLMNGDVVPGHGKPDLCHPAGALYRLMPLCDGIGGTTYSVGANAVDITHVLFRVFVKPKGGEFPACATTFEEPLGWKKP